MEPKNKLYVGNLDYSVGENDLKSLFEEFGEITEAVVISEGGSGRSKGFGFVTFKTDEEAEAAAKGMDGKEHKGRNLTVNVARPRREG